MKNSVNTIHSMSPRNTGKQKSSHGLGQLTLVEHSLCPLDARSSLKPGLMHRTSFQYSDAGRRRRTATVEISCPMGLSAHDEFYLWGLLALTLNQPQPEPEFHATPHYCLRQLGMVDADARRGGRQYQQFAAAIERMSWVKYGCDAFYDPVRAEHCRVRFGFFSYRLPLDPDSSRVWRFHWDAQFFEFARSQGGALWFDLERYRSLSPAARRLFLFVSKVNGRSKQFPRLSLHQIAVEILGLSAQLSTKHLLAKTRRVWHELKDAGVLMEQQTDPIRKLAKGAYEVGLRPGPALNHQRRKAVSTDSPLVEPLRDIGVDEHGIQRLLNRYPQRIIREWVDITLAARERFSAGFFKRSAAAYLIDNIKKAASEGRTPPDWWHEVRKAEELRWEADLARQAIRRTNSNHRSQTRKAFDSDRRKLIEKYQASGVDSQTATIAAGQELRRRSTRQLNAAKSPASTGEILTSFPIKLV